MSMLLEGKKAIVTGGSRGIGRAIVAAFLREGASVNALSRTSPADQAELEGLAAEHGGSFRWRAADVTDERAMVAALEAIAAEAGQVHVLVNNAGITRDGLVFRMPTEDWEAVLRANLTSAFVASRAVAKLMIRQRSGSIIMMASVSGMMGNAGQTNYAASKAGLIGLAKSLAREVAPRGVRVNAIAPGFIETDMTKSLGEKVREAFLAQIPLGRMGRPEEVAELAVFLASDRSAYITGQVVPVDGGLAM
jgi:3-oxoacyl-[acyl-carrier protein] reductase